MSRIDEAMRSVVREDFLPDGQKGSAGFDAALPIGGGSTCSQPTTVRNMLELLDPCPGDSVLDVGSGSGWTTAILAELVGDGTVTGVELLPDLVERSRETLSGRAVDNATIVQATEGVLGHPEGSPYDRILVSADAEGSVPQELIDQLADGGVLVCPVDGMMTRVEKSAGGTGMVEVSEHGLYRFVPLVVRDH